MLCVHMSMLIWEIIIGYKECETNNNVRTKIYAQVRKNLSLHNLPRSSSSRKQCSLEAKQGWFFST